MIFIFKKRIVISIVLALFGIFSISYVSFINDESIINVSNEMKTYKIVVDAGHGAPDGGIRFKSRNGRKIERCT